ncbi:MAG: tRNA pseudouridine(38-40) synthase TruA [Ruminococcus sp.]|nr:tRNA pseudouridine(38-40) synthase TruA [Ruminococcus sp.]
MRNLKVIMTYKGTAYHGFQIQDNAVTVQDVVEKCVSRVLNSETSITGCSRTDAGVHANRYCFSVLTDSKIPEKSFVRGVNSYLPSDISILSCEEVPLDFHARYSCKAKEYVYLIHNSECRNPFAEDLQYHYRRKMDIELMRKAAAHFIGTHDFRSFCSARTDKTNTVRTIYELSIEKENELVKIFIKGDGFLYNMVRIIVGTLLSVNEGKISADEIPLILEKTDRLSAGKTAQAHGLYLNRVFY